MIVEIHRIDHFVMSPKAVMKKLKDAKAMKKMAAKAMKVDIITRLAMKDEAMKAVDSEQDDPWAELRGEIVDPKDGMLVDGICKKIKDAKSKKQIMKILDQQKKEEEIYMNELIPVEVDVKGVDVIAMEVIRGNFAQIGNTKIEGLIMTVNKIDQYLKNAGGWTGWESERIEDMHTIDKKKKAENAKIAARIRDSTTKSRSSGSKGK